MAPYTFKATTDSIKTNADYHVPFTTVVDNTLGAQYDPITGTLVTPRSGTYALSVKLVPPPSFGSDFSVVAECEIVVDGVETPLVLNEEKTCARVVLKLNHGKSVWVECSGGNTPLLTPGAFSVCLLHEPVGTA